MRRPFLIPLSIAIVLVVLMLGFEAASYSTGRWGVMGPQMMGSPGPWGGYGPPYTMHGYMMRGDAPFWGARDLNLSADAVKTQLARWLAWQGNPRLKLGDVKEKDADTIIADIVTRDGSIAQRLGVNRHSGFMQDVEDQP